MNDNEDFNIAEEHFNNEEYEDAFRLYKSLAERGSVESQVFLGWMYQNGLGVRKDSNTAYSWYEKAAKLGSAEGQFYLAKSCARKKDYEGAKDWYLKSADKGYAPALFRLGWIYDIGRGVKEDKEKALYYYTRAVNLGHVFAQKYLAVLMIKGHLGFIARFNGVFQFIRSLFRGVIIASSDQHDDRIRE